MDEEFKAKQKLNILGEPDITKVEKQPFQEDKPIYEDLPPHPKAITPIPPQEPVEVVPEQVIPKKVKKTRNKKPFIIAALALVILGLGVSTYLYLHSKKPKPTESNDSLKVDGKPVSISIYKPKNLPTGYVFNNDLKEIKTNVIYFSIEGPKKELFYVTQQSIPANFDFALFNKKFATPDTFNASSGTATAGTVGPNLIGSIRTSKNTWIIINSSPTATLAQLETVIRSFELAN